MPPQPHRPHNRLPPHAKNLSKTSLCCYRSSIRKIPCRFAGICSIVTMCDHVYVECGVQCGVTPILPAGGWEDAEDYDQTQHQSCLPAVAIGRTPQNVFIPSHPHTQGTPRIGILGWVSLSFDAELLTAHCRRRVRSLNTLSPPAQSYFIWRTQPNSTVGCVIGGWTRFVPMAIVFFALPSAIPQNHHTLNTVISS